MMRRLAVLFLLLPGPPTAAAAQEQPVWNPPSAYITQGQEESGYRRWIAADGLRPVLVTSFENYLRRYEVAGVVPTWQLLRTATSWHRCGAQPFEVPPAAEWHHVVQTLRYVKTHVVPVVGPVEAVSAYRNPELNICAGGSADSAHKGFFAIDLVPLHFVEREGMIRSLCAIHAWRGTGYEVGLGFYSFHRFHVDSRKFRRWGPDGTPEASPCTAALAELGIATAEASKERLSTP